LAQPAPFFVKGIDFTTLPAHHGAGVRRQLRLQGRPVFVEYDLEVAMALRFVAITVVSQIVDTILRVLGFDSTKLCLKLEFIPSDSPADFRNQIANLRVRSVLGGSIKSMYTTFTNVYQLEYLRDGFFTVQDLILQVVIVFGVDGRWSF